MGQAQLLKKRVQQLEQARKEGKITLKYFYKELLELLAELKDFLEEENLPDSEIKRQIPVLLFFIKEQLETVEHYGIHLSKN
jgi:hypothetical protein